jgi:Fe-S cluster assembly iron-binding protein IscA
VYKLKTEEPEEKKVVFATNGEEMKMLKGATIDYAEEMMREIFYVKENPNAEISCSCKTSFSPKNYVF